MHEYFAQIPPAVFFVVVFLAAFVATLGAGAAVVIVLTAYDVIARALKRALPSGALSALFLIGALGVAAALTGCDDRSKSEADAFRRADAAGRAGVLVTDGSGSGGRVVLIRLPDGTPCAVFVGASKGGLSCNWKAPVTPPVQTRIPK